MTGAAVRSVPRICVGMILWLCRPPGVINSGPIIGTIVMAGHIYQGVPVSLKIGLARGSRTKQITKVEIPPYYRTAATAI